MGFWTGLLFKRILCVLSSVYHIRLCIRFMVGINFFAMFCWIWVALVHDFAGVSRDFRVTDIAMAL